MDYIRRADILKRRALAATPFFHDSYGYTEGKVVENKNPNIMYLVSTYRGRATRTTHNYALPNNARNQQAIYATPNPTGGNTQHTPCNQRRTKCGHTTQNPYTKNKQLHEIKAPNQKYAIVTRNRQQCTNRKQRDPRNLQQKSRFQLPESKPFKHHSTIAMVPHRARRRRTKSAQERKKERRNEERKRPWLFYPI
jgi:hypothetical protein